MHDEAPDDTIERNTACQYVVLVTRAEQI